MWARQRKMWSTCDLTLGVSSLSECITTWSNALQIRCQTSLCVKQTQVSTLDSYKKGYSRSSGVTVFCLTLITQYKFRLWLAITHDLSSYVGLKHTRQYTTLHSNGCFLITPEYYIFTAVLILWVCETPYVPNVLNTVCAVVSINKPPYTVSVWEYIINSLSTVSIPLYRV